MTTPPDDDARHHAGSEQRRRTVLVTGAARGIGRSIAVAFAHEGYDVIGADIAGPVSETLDYAPASRDDLDATGERVQAQGAHWESCVFDQRDMVAVRRTAEEIAERRGGIDVLVANAGIQAFASLLEMTDAVWHDQIDTNLTGTANVLRAFAPQMVERGGGRIIVVSSMQGQQGTKDGSAYSASKWGLIGLVKSVALELGEHGITVNALIPGLIDTPLTRHEDRYAQIIDTSGETPTGDPEQDEQTARASKAAETPLGMPWIDPDDVAPLAVFLASDAARVVSGTSFAATGGVSANVTA